MNEEVEYGSGSYTIEITTFRSRYILMPIGFGYSNANSVDNGG
jgi:hypothetical protein